MSLHVDSLWPKNDAERNGLFFFAYVFFYRNRVIGFIRFLTRWSFIRIIGSQKIVQFTILVPLIGYYIIFSQQFCEFTNTIGDIDLGLKCSEYPSTKTFIIYFGFTFIAVAQLLYAIFCPALIKTYGDKYDYINKESQHIQEGKFVSLATKISQKVSRYALDELLLKMHLVKLAERQVRDLVRDLSSYEVKSENHIKMDELADKIDELKKENRNVLIQIYNESKNEVLEVNYLQNERRLLIIRVSALLLYLIGFSLLLWQSGDTFYKIWMIFYHNLP